MCATFCLVSCDDYQVSDSDYNLSSDRYYLSSDLIMIVPKLSDGVQYVEYTLDSKYIYTSFEMPFVLELKADTLSSGYHIVGIKQHGSISEGYVSYDKYSTVAFTIL